MKKTAIFIGMLLIFLQSNLLVYATEDYVATKNDTKMEEQLDQIMAKYIGKEIPGASIGIVKDGKVILSKGYGVSDVDNGTPVTPDKTVFELASVTKVFTWSMLMRLVEEGKLDLEADIQNYLPKETLKLTFDKKITVLDLMNHTAGFEEKIEGMDLDSTDQIKPLKETLTKENQPKQIYEPGTVTAYSNYGANLGGYIIEQLTGKDYMEYMNQFTREQLQMNHSTFSMLYEDQPNITENKSLGYTLTDSKLETADPNGGLTNDFPAGSLQSTTADMTHFVLALLNNDGKAPYAFFEKTDTLKQLQTHSQGIVPDALGNAHGFWEEEANGKRIIGHGGNSGGFSSQLTLVPEEGLGYILLTNVANEATGIRDDLKELLIGKDTSPTDLVLKKSATDKRVAGRYRMARNMESTLGKIAYILVDLDMVVSENKEGGISVTSPQEKEGISYVEVKPGIYQKIQEGATPNYLYFEVNEVDKVLRTGSGMVTDYIPVSFLDTQLFNLMIFGISFIAFLSSLIYLSVKFTRQRRKKKLDGWSLSYTVTAIFSSIGLLVMINSIIMIAKFVANLTMTFSSMQLLFYFNWLLPIALIGMIIWLAMTWRKNNAKGLTISLIIVGLNVTMLFYNVHLFY